MLISDEMLFCLTMYWLQNLSLARSYDVCDIGCVKL